MTIWTASKRKSAPRSSTSAVTNTRRPHRREQQKKQRLVAALRLVLAVVHHRDTNVTHADVTRRRGWPFIVVGLGIGSVARQAAQLSSSGWRGRDVPTASVPPGQILGAAGDSAAIACRRLGNTQIRPSHGPALKKTRRRTPAAGRASGGACGGLSWGHSRGFLCFLPPKILRLGTINFGPNNGSSVEPRETRIWLSGLASFSPSRG